MIHLALRSEYSFKRCYGFIENMVNYANGISIGVADDANTFAHVAHHRSCIAASVKPILGVRLMVCDKFIEKKKLWGPKYIFLAKNQKGLSEIYRLVFTAYDQFYYHPRLQQSDLNDISENVFVIATNFNHTNRIDYIGIDQFTPEIIGNWSGIPKVAICLNWYFDVEDREVYQLHAGTRNMESQTFPQHILSEAEWLRLWPDRAVANAAVTNTYKISSECEMYDLPKAPNLTYPGKVSLRQLCIAGARKRKLDITKGEYHDRLEREMSLIEERGFSDYFLVVAQMVRAAKHKMLVGPSRGSSGGSLVSFLVGITEIDPLKYGLLFERFIDVNRTDMPDIDIDFPDKKRRLVIDGLSQMYGEEYVSRIATVSKMKPKISIGEFAAGLGIPAYETDTVKEAIVQRSSGDARATMAIEDTFETTDIGREFIEKYPRMGIVKRIETHARHSGVHAAGIIVCNDKLTNYGGVNARDGVFMMDHRDAAKLNLLKIDCLGLRTLSILESVADQIRMPYSDYYDLPLDDEKVFDIFNSMRLSGIFQFQGNALQHATRMMGVYSFDDICAIGALARPGPIHSGGTNIFIGRRTGVDPVEYLSDHPAVIRATKATYGVIIYQEQLMMIAREYGRMTWADVSALRKGTSKSLGEEFFNKYRDQFLKGAIENGADPEEADKVWDNMVTFGCLSGDTVIPLPTSNQYSPKSITIKELCKNQGYAKISAEYWNREAQLERGPSKILCMIELGNTIKPVRLDEVYESGVKETWLLKAGGFYEIRATKNHMFFTNHGWKALEDLKIGDQVSVVGGSKKTPSGKFRYPGTGSGAHNKHGLNTTAEIEKFRQIVRGGIDCNKCDALAENVHHIDGNRYNNNEDNIEFLCCLCHRKSHMDNYGYRYKRGKTVEFIIITSISSPKIEVTYDIRMPTKYANFVANGFIVHNSWGFNKSHAYGYGLISYWTAWAKAHHPLEYAVANLNNTKRQDIAIKILRDMVRNDGIEYTALDPDVSTEEWSVHSGKLIGGLTSIKGIGPKKAKQILKARAGKATYTKSQVATLMNPETPFDILFPCDHWWGDIFENYKNYGLEKPPVAVETIVDPGEYVFIAKLMVNNLRDLNETQAVAHRGGKYLTDHTLFLFLTVEDDTSSIIAIVDRYQYERLGRHITNTAKVEHDWFLIKGTIKDRWRRVNVKEILNLNQWGKEHGIGPDAKIDKVLSEASVSESDLPPGASDL